MLVVVTNSVKFLCTYTTFEFPLGFVSPFQSKLSGHKCFLFVVFIVSVWIISIRVGVIVLSVLRIVIYCLLVDELLGIGFIYNITFDGYSCCDMGQNDTIGKIELIPAFVLSTDNTNC